jgi:hypothetical protein
LSVSKEHRADWEQFGRGTKRSLAPRTSFPKEPTLVGSVGFNRHESAGVVKEEDLKGLRLWAPHLRRAATISNLFDMKALRQFNDGLNQSRV